MGTLLKLLEWWSLEDPGWGLLLAMCSLEGDDAHPATAKPEPSSPSPLPALGEQAVAALMQASKQAGCPTPARVVCLACSISSVPGVAGAPLTTSSTPQVKILHCQSPAHGYSLHLQVFLNCSTSDVVATTSLEALAMGKWVVAAEHPCNAFIAHLPNCLIYTCPEEFSQHLQTALEQEPALLSPEDIR